MKKLEPRFCYYLASGGIEKGGMWHFWVSRFRHLPCFHTAVLEAVQAENAPSDRQCRAKRMDSDATRRLRGKVAYECRECKSYRAETASRQRVLVKLEMRRNVLSDKPEPDQGEIR